MREQMPHPAMRGRGGMPPNMGHREGHPRGPEMGGPQNPHQMRGGPNNRRMHMGANMGGLY